VSGEAKTASSLGRIEASNPVLVHIFAPEGKSTFRGARLAIAHLRGRRPGRLTGSPTPGRAAGIHPDPNRRAKLAALANTETTVVQSAIPANVDTMIVEGRTTAVCCTTTCCASSVR